MKRVAAIKRFTFKKFTSAALAAVLVLTFVPLTAVAEEPAGNDVSFYSTDSTRESLSVPAAITTDSSGWVLENEVLKTGIEFDPSDGSIDMISFYNKEADKEYLKGDGDRNLFKYKMAEELSSEGDIETPFITVECGDFNRISYFGNGWVNMSPRPTINDGDYFEFKFKGAAIEYYGTTHYNRGLTEIYIDGVLMDIVDMYMPLDIPEADKLVYANYSLSQNEHILKAVCRHNGEKDGYALNAMNIKYLRYGGADTTTLYAADEYEKTDFIDNNDSRISYTGNWWPVAPPNAYGGTQHITNETGAYAICTFTGSSVKIYGTKWHNRGFVDIYLDDMATPAATVDMYSSSSGEPDPSLLFVSGSIEYKEHTVKFQCTGQQNASADGAHIFLDCLEITRPASSLEDEDSVVIVNTDPSVTYSRSPERYTPPHSTGATAAYLPWAGEYAELTFVGTSVRIYGSKDSNRGIADIYLDDFTTPVASVDMYAPVEDNYPVLLYNSGRLTEGTHTVRFACSGRTSGGSTYVVLDRFETTMSTINEVTELIGNLDSTRVYYSVTPSRYPPPNSTGGLQSYLRTPSTYAEFTFTGTSVKIYGSRDNNRGFADIYLDDMTTPVASVDMNIPAEDFYPALLYYSGRIPYGPHTVRFLCSGRTTSGDTWIALDRFVITTGEPLNPSKKYEIKLDGTWSEANYTAGTVTPNDSFSFDFMGDFFEIHGAVGPDKGVAEVFIDGIKAATVDMYNPIPVDRIVYIGRDLFIGEHEVKVVNTDGKNSLSSGNGMSVKKVAFGTMPGVAATIGLGTVSAADGGWELADSRIEPIELYGVNWGKRLEIDLSRQDPEMTVTLSFEIYNGRSGLQYHTFIRNDSAGSKLRVMESDIISLNFTNDPHVIHYVPFQVAWSTAQTLSKARRNCVTRYDTGDGWSINPENNWATSLVPGGFNADHENTFLFMDVWNGNDNVKIYSNPKAVQLVLFPEEQREYFGINLSVFKGDDTDGRMAVAEHFRKRYKYADPTKRLSTNNWGYKTVYGNHRLWESHYINSVLPVCIETNMDAIHIDDFWNGEGTTFIRDSEKFMTDITLDPVGLIRQFNNAGLKFGIWYSPNGGEGSGWGTPKDLADKSWFPAKYKQMDETILAADKYNSKWDQIDLGLFWKEDRVTAYSHPTDSVFRKVMNLREYMENFTHKDVDLFMQTTCEVDNPGGPQNVALIHIVDNGLAGMYGRTEYGDQLKDLFGAFGLFPLESQLMTWGEDQSAPWYNTTEWFYKFLVARHTSIYTDPDLWQADGKVLLRKFNDWRKNPRMASLLNELYRPVYTGSNMGGPFIWMFADEAKSKAIVIGVGHTDPATSYVDAQLRWLDDNKTYLVEDITMLDGGKDVGHFGEYDYRFVTKKTGAQLKSEGLRIDFDTNYSRAKMYWIQEYKPVMQQVLYADSAVTSFTESWDGERLTVNITGGMPNATAKIIVYKEYVANTEVKEVLLNAEGKGQVTFSGKAVTEPFALLKKPGEVIDLIKISDTNTNYVSYSDHPWQGGSPPDAYMGTERYSATEGATVTFTFAGHIVKWYGSKDSNRGIADVYIDDMVTPYATIDLYSPTLGSSGVLLSVDNLSDGDHVLKIVCTGRQNPASANCFICIDCFEIVRPKTLALAALPVITEQPEAAAAVAGKAAFKVAASGVGLTYQWKKNGVDIAGATSDTLELTDARLTDAGLYSVIVSNPYGTVASSEAVLTVAPPPITSLKISDDEGNPMPSTVAASRNSTVSFSIIANDGALCDGLVWTSSDTSLATVDNYGNVTIMNKTGMVVLTVKDAESGISHSIVLRIT